MRELGSKTVFFINQSINKLKLDFVFCQISVVAQRGMTHLQNEEKNKYNK